MELTVKMLYDHFLSQADWVDINNTSDKIRFGDGDRKVRKIGVGWSACVQNLTAAAKDNCDLFISHENPFAWPWGEVNASNTEWYKNRVKVLSDNNMALMNLHDTWDHWTEYGIIDSWAQFLKVGQLVKEMDYIHPRQSSVTTGKSSLGIYSVPETTVEDFAKEIVHYINEIGSNGVTVMGNPKAKVSTVALGVGCHIPTFEAFYEGVDLLIMVYDRADQQVIRIPLAEIGANLIVTEHSIAEIPAMKSMCTYLKKEFPQLEVLFYNHEPRSFVYSL